jgi:phosphate-selective porin OprO and OprP
MDRDSLRVHRTHWLWGGLLCALPLAASAQSVETDLPDGYVPNTPDSYFIPDFSQDAYKNTSHVDEHDRFSIKLGLVVLVDYTDFSQDDESIQQVGLQEDAWQARSIRFMARGHFDLWRKWNYIVAYEYKGFDKNNEANWSSTDITVSTDIAHLGTLSIGKLKEPFVYEMVGDAANLPHTERLLSPFFVSRNTGIRLSNTMFDQRGTWSVGVYNNWLSTGNSFNDAGLDVAGRVTWLPVWRDEGKEYLHLGVALRYYSGAQGVLRLKGKPASNVADNFVDTGNLDGDHAWNLGLEALYARDNWSVLGEYVRSEASLRAQSNANFQGWYLTGSWFLTGENRPYDRKVAYARRVQPSGRWGALELMGRAGRVDLDDAGVSGGKMDGWWAGVNWWATRRWKASVTYGNVDLERGGLDGNTKAWLYRLQWIY